MKVAILTLSLMASGFALGVIHAPAVRCVAIGAPYVAAIDFCIKTQGGAR